MADSSPATFVERAAEVNNHVAEQRARDKHAKYDALAKQELVDFKAYSADAFGAVSNDARDLVRWMATEACAFGAASYSDFVSDANIAAGGPVVKNKVRFFGSFRDWRVHQNVPVQNSQSVLDQTNCLPIYGRRSPP